MTNPGDFADTVKQQADIVRIISDYVKLKKSGGQNFSGLCPFHQEKTPSFSVHATRQFYHCFGCGESGDVFKFVQKVENVTFPEAVRLIAQKLDIPVPKISYSSEAEAHDARRRGALLDIQERAGAWFQEQLRRPEAAHAREYLAGRGLDAKTIGEFRIGYAPDSGFLLRDALRHEFSEELLKASGLFSWKEAEPPSPVSRPPSPAEASPQETGPGVPGTGDRGRETTMYAKFRNRVMFPISNEAGKVIAFTGRTLASDEKAGPKYLNSPETPIYSKSHVLFNLNKAKEAIRKFNHAILVEGQMDCISVYAAGLHNVIATSGTAFTEAQARLLARFSKNIVVNFDPDAAGAAAAERSLAMLVEQEFQIKVVTLETGYDPDLFVRHKGRQAYEAELRAAPKYFDYLIERAQKNFPRSPEGKVKAVNFLLPHVQRVPSRIVRDELANEIAQKLAIDSAVLRQELRHVAVARGAQQVKTAPLPQAGQLERRLIRALAEDVHSQLRQIALEEIGPDLEMLEGLPAGSLIAKLVRADDLSVDRLDLSEAETRLFASILMSPDKQERQYQESLTPELIRQEISFLRRSHPLRTELAAITRQIAELQKSSTPTPLELGKRKLEVEQALAAISYRDGGAADRRSSLDAG